MSQTIVETYHEYESVESGSLQFLENLLSDRNSYLNSRDIYGILGCLERREQNLPFTIGPSHRGDLQGILWTRDLRRKFQLDRWRVGRQSWFHNVDRSRELAVKNLTVTGVHGIDSFYTFERYYPKLRIDITHFQLRNLVCCNSYASFYPSNDNDCFTINRMMIDADNPARSGAVKLDCLVESKSLAKNAFSRVSTLACNDNWLVCGTFEGGYILFDISDPDSSKVVGEYTLTDKPDGITNHVIVDDTCLRVSGNDRSLRTVDLTKNKTTSRTQLASAVNCAAPSATNHDLLYVVVDSIDSYIIDLRTNEETLRFSGHHDYGFSCDWSKTNENLLISGNQDTTMCMWDRRSPSKPLHRWSGALGESSSLNAGPVRNCKFSTAGEYVCWAESLDHVGIVRIDELEQGTIDRAQSIDYIGKCVGLNFTESDNGHGERLTIGINDCQLGGIIEYKLESSHKCLDYDFAF